MNTPIALQQFDPDEYRKFVRTLSDQELLKAGKQLRQLCGDVVSTVPSVFDEQLKICREEWRQASEMSVRKPRRAGAAGST